jgi:peptidoglycan/xylan/chitin deacetylase (PgdA/CDA1 family)
VNDDMATLLRWLVVAGLIVVIIAGELSVVGGVANDTSQASGSGTSQPTHPQQPSMSSPPSAPVHSAQTPPPTVDALGLPPVNGVTTVVSLTFDDGVLDQYTLRRLLPPSGLTATVYVNSGLIAVFEDPADRMSLPALRDLARHGVEIGGHTVDHPDLTTLTLNKARAEICDDRDKLLSLGFPAVSFAYPYSQVDARVERIPRSCGYLSARSVGGIDCYGCTAAETFPPLNRYSLRTPDPVERRTTLRTLKSQVLKAERAATATTRTWLILNFHHICNGCNKLAITKDRLAALLGWLSHRPPSTAVRAVGAVMLHGFQ